MLLTFRNCYIFRANKVYLHFCKFKHQHHCHQTVGWVFNNFVPSSSCSLPHIHSRIYIASISVGPRILPFFGVLNSSRILYQSVFTKSCSYHKAETADDLLNHIIRTVEYTDIYSAELLHDIESLCKLGGVSAVSDLIQALRRKGIYLRSDAYDILLAFTSERNDTVLSIEIFKDLLVSSKGMSFKSYLYLAQAFVNTDDHSQLLKLVREVSQLTSHCEVLVFNRLIYAFSECRQIDKALILYDHLKVLECKPDLVTYNTVIGLFGRAGLVDDMLQEFSSMKEANISPDIVTYNTLLNNLQKLNRLDLCLVYMREMGENGLIPDLRTYTALIESFGRSGNVEEAVNLFNAMKSRRVQPSIYIYRSLINNLKKMGKLKDAAALSNEMNSSLPYLVGPKDFKRKTR